MGALQGRQTVEVFRCHPGSKEDDMSNLRKIERDKMRENEIDAKTYAKEAKIDAAADYKKAKIEAKADKAKAKLQEEREKLEAEDAERAMYSDRSLGEEAKEEIDGIRSRAKHAMQEVRDKVMEAGERNERTAEMEEARAVEEAKERKCCRKNIQ